MLSDNALHRGDDENIGGICNWPSREIHVAEIIFCAVNIMHQLKGSGIS